MSNYNNQVKEAKEFIEEMSVIADYLDSIKNEHMKNGDFFKRAQSVLVNYRTMKFHQLAFSTNITSDQCRKEINRRGDEIFDYFKVYEDLPESNSQEYPTIATVYDVLDLCGDTFTTKHLEDYLNSNRISFEAILSILCEQILLEIKKRNEIIFEVLYTEYFNLAMEGSTAPQRWEEVGLNRNTYYNNLNRGITLFSLHLFTPYGELYKDKNEDKRRQFLEHIKAAANIVIEMEKGEET